jgi:hypothetical protein
MTHKKITLASLIERLWDASENAEWKPKTAVLPLLELKEWMTSDDLEVLGFVNAQIHDRRFSIEPALPIFDYVQWVKHYYGRCFRENPDGEWSASSYSSGWDFVGVFISLWDNVTVPRTHLLELKEWLADVYRAADDKLRTCIVHASLEHLCERKPIRKYFSDWLKDPILAPAYKEACLWDRKTPLSR